MRPIRAHNMPADARWRAFGIVLFIAAAACLDAQTQSGSKEYIRLGGRVIAVENSSLSITPAGPFTALLNSRFSQTLTAQGGASPYTWTSTGTLPAGISFAATGATTASLSGTPTQAGTYMFTVKATDASGMLYVSTSITITVSNLGITTTSLPGVQVNTAYPSTTLTATGGTGSYTWTAVSLPAGLSLSNGGTITGTPTAVGNPSVAFTVTDSSKTSITRNLSIDVVNPLSIANSTLSNTGQCPTYSATVSATGGQTPYSFAWSANPGSSLPPGLSLNASTGVISGTCPSIGGPYSFMVTATDSLTPTALTASKSYTMTGAVSVTGPPSLPNGQQGSQYNSGASIPLTATGGTPPYTWSVVWSPSSPGFLLISQSNLGNYLEVTGNPTNAGTFTGTFTATDANNQSGNATFTFTISGGLEITSASVLPPATANQSYSQQLTAAGGSPPYSWTWYAGDSLPNITVSQGGQLSGTPFEGSPGVYQYKPEFRVTDSAGASAVALLSLTVYAPVTGGPGITAWTSGDYPQTQDGLQTTLANNLGQYPGASWSLTGDATGLYGTGTLSPYTDSSCVPNAYCKAMYVSPLAVMEDQQVDITATASGESSSQGINLLVPPPATFVAGTAMADGTSGQTGQTVPVSWGQPVVVQTTFYLGDNWQSSNDYIVLSWAQQVPHSAIPGPAFCQIYYTPNTHTVMLWNDGAPDLSGTSFSTGTIGSTTTLSTTSCSINLAGATDTRNSGAAYMMTLSIPVTFSAVESGTTNSFNQALGLTSGPGAVFPTGAIAINTGSGSPAISVNPASAILGPTKTQQFTATVTNESNTAVTWSISPAVGTISATGLYTAPSTISSVQTVTVTATSQALSTLKATAAITLSPNGCGTTDLNLPNTTASGTTTYAANHNVNATNGFSISGSAIATFQACNQIVLGPGFTANFTASGSTGSFTAVVGH